MTSSASPNRTGAVVASRGVLGIDEAGRGAALGPLVVAGVVLDPRKAGALTRLGVRDSKRVGAGEAARTRRRALAAHVRRLAECVEVEVFQASEVDRFVESGGLNQLERNAAEEILRRVGPVRRVVADGRRLFEALAARYPNFEAVDRAEARHVAVAAASVVAKDRRDALFRRICEGYRDRFGEVKGGGYVNRATQAFLRRHHDATGELPPETRRSWSWDVVRELAGPRSLWDE